MTITFAEARALAYEELADGWPEGAGTFYIAESGSEDADGYAIGYGAEEWIVGLDHAYQVLGNEVAFVDKADGYVHKEPFLMVEQRLQQMTPVSLADSAG